MAIVPFTGDTSRGLVGQHVNSEEWNAITRLADNVAAAPIGFGQPVARFAGNDKVCRQWATGKPLGITRYRIDVDGVAGYEEGGHVSIMTEGVMWVASGAACTAGGPAYYNPTTDRWGNTGASYVNVPGVEFDTNATAAGQMVKIRIRIPAAAAAS